MTRLACLIILTAATLATVKPHPALAQPADSVQVGAERPAEKLVNTITESRPQWSLTFGKVFWALVIFAGGYFLIKYVTRFLNALSERWPKLRLTIKRLYPVVRIVGWTGILYVIVADVLAPPIATLVAVTASAGIAVGLAAQDIIKNVFGGLMILFDRPFQVGDKIRVGDHYGEVTDIGLRTVRIVTPSDSTVSIPNAELVTHAVSNANSGENNCQVVADFYLTPNVNITEAKRVAMRAAAVSRYVYLDKPISVVLVNEVHEGRSLIKMSLKAYVMDIRFEFPFLSEMTELVMTALIEQRVADPDELAAAS